MSSERVNPVVLRGFRSLQNSRAGSQTLSDACDRGVHRGALKHDGRRIRLRRVRWRPWMRIAKVDGPLGRIGKVRMVLSKRPRDPWKKTLAVVTNETGLEARNIMTIFEKRWNIEVLFKELRNSLGLCDYQVLSRNAIERHLHLCCMAHLLLTHHAIKDAGAQANEKDNEVTLPHFNERLENLRNSIRREQARRFLKRIKNRDARQSYEPFSANSKSRHKNRSV